MAPHKNFDCLTINLFVECCTSTALEEDCVAASMGRGWGSEYGVLLVGGPLNMVWFDRVLNRVLRLEVRGVDPPVPAYGAPLSVPCSLHRQR